MTFADWQPAPVLTDHLGMAPPTLLSHYTNQRGLLGILQTHTLWASNIRFLNDHKEYEYGVDLILHELLWMNAEAKADSERSLHFDGMLKAMSELHPNTSVYVASWSDTDDDLAQWRAYSEGGPGYAVRMSGQVLRTLADAQHYMFAACIYDPNEQKRRAREIIGVSVQEMIDDVKGGIQYARARPADKFMFRLLRFASLFKHESFAAEREWRLVSQYPGVEVGPGFGVREGRSMLVPYVTFNLKHEGIPANIPELVVGPCAEPKRAMQAADVALRKYVPPIHAQTRTVRSSRVPYRNW